MAIPGPLLTRRRVIRVKLETTRGEAIVPDVELKCFDPQIQATGPYIERKPVRASGGHDVGVIGERVGTFSVRSELRGDGAASGGDLDAGLAVLFKCCGMQLSGGVYKPQSVAASQNTCTIYVYEDGVLKALTGAAGTYTIEGEFGKLAIVNFEMSGIWVAVSDDALPETSHNATVPPRVASASFTIGSESPKVSRFSLTFGGVVSAREDIDTAAGVLHYSVVDRDPRFEVDPEEETVANNDFFGDWLAGTTAAMSIQIGGTAGNQITIAAPKLQYAELTEGDREGKAILDLNGVCLTNSDLGEDDITLTPA